MLLRNRDRIVQVHGARCLHAIVFVQDDLGGHSSYGGCYWGNRDRRQISDRTLTRKDHYRSFLIRRSERIKADIAPIYSAGHAASASQSTDSSGVDFGAA